MAMSSRTFPLLKNNCCLILHNSTINSQVMTCAPNVSWKVSLLTTLRFCVTLSRWSVTARPRNNPFIWSYLPLYYNYSSSLRNCIQMLYMWTHMSLTEPWPWTMRGREWDMHVRKRQLLTQKSKASLTLKINQMDRGLGGFNACIHMVCNY